MWSSVVGLKCSGCGQVLWVWCKVWWLWSSVAGVVH